MQRETLQQETNAHARTAANALIRLHQVEGMVFATTTAGFAVGLALLAAFTTVAVGYQRIPVRQAAGSRHQALHDPLTGLAEPDAVHRPAHPGTPRDPAHPRQHRRALLDLDRFKEVNDTLGHHYGDDLLRQVATRTAGAVRAGDTVARLPGDEFAVLLPDTDAEQADALAELRRHVTPRGVHGP